MRMLTRVAAKGRRILARSLHRQPLRIATEAPLVTFTFDDAPCSAFDAGREILEAYGGRGTYFVSLGLAGTVTELGPIADIEKLGEALRSGHELGCHTFDHLDAWTVPAVRYVESVDANQAALSRHFPGERFRSFAYPRSGATHAVKRALAERFDCCRGGGQTFNAGVVDRSLLSACFLDARAGVDLAFVRNLISDNAEARGWLIFAAHEIADEGSIFRCTPDFFASVVASAMESGARLVPMSEAYSVLRKTTELSND